MSTDEQGRFKVSGVLTIEGGDQTMTVDLSKGDLVGFSSGLNVSDMDEDGHRDILYDEGVNFIIKVEHLRGADIPAFKATQVTPDSE